MFLNINCFILFKYVINVYKNNTKIFGRCNRNAPEKKNACGKIHIIGDMNESMENKFNIRSSNF